MGFFDQALGGGAGAQSPMMGGGMGGGSPSAFTSPGMNPQILALLMAMQRQSGGGMGGAPGGPMPSTPPTPGQNAPSPGGIPAPPTPTALPTPNAGQQGAPNLDALKALLARLGMGGGNPGASIQSLNGGQLAGVGQAYGGAYGQSLPGALGQSFGQGGGWG